MQKELHVIAFFRAAVVLLVMSLTSAIGHARGAGDRPNVVVIFLDDSGYGDYAHNGNPTIRTPNISRLVQDGMNFTQFYVTSPACSASRYSLLTGRYPGRSGLGSWVIGPGAQRHIHPNEITLAEGLKARGYQTGIFGKWHLGSPNSRNSLSLETLPLAHGFDEWLGTNVSHDYGSAMLLKSDASGSSPIKGYSVIAKNLPSEPEICASLTQRSTEAALSFIERNKAKPFFVYIPYNMPHLSGPVMLDRLPTKTKVKQPMKKRRKFTAEFKGKVALEALREQQPIHVPRS